MRVQEAQKDKYGRTFSAAGTVRKERNNRFGTDGVSCKHTCTHPCTRTYVEDVERKVLATRKAKKRENADMPVRPQTAAFSPEWMVVLRSFSARFFLGRHLGSVTTAVFV